MSYLDFFCVENGEHRVQIVKKLCTSSQSILELVQQAESDLQSKNDEDRSLAIEYVSLLSIHHLKLNKDEQRFLFEFLLEKLTESLAVQVLLTALTRLVGENSNSATRILKVVCSNYDVRNEKQLLRSHFYTLCFESLKNSDNFEQQDLVALLELVEGEKDPRNLIIVFPMLALVGRKFTDLCNQNVGLFLNASFCYFPISFTPPADDPYGITEEKLRILLKEAMLSCDNAYLFKLLLEKISSVHVLAKEEAFEFILDNFEYFQLCIVAHLDELLKAISFSTMCHKSEYKETIFNDASQPSVEGAKMVRELDTLTALCHRFLAKFLEMPYLDINVLDRLFAHAKNNLELLSVFGQFTESFNFALPNVLSLDEPIESLFFLVKGGTNCSRKLYDYVFDKLNTVDIFLSKFASEFIFILGKVVQQFPEEQLLDSILKIYLSGILSFETKELIIEHIFIHVKDKKLLWKYLEVVLNNEKHADIILPAIKSSKYIAQCVISKLYQAIPTEDYHSVIYACLEQSDSLLKDLHYFLYQKFITETDFLEIFLNHLYKLKDYVMNISSHADFKSFDCKIEFLQCLHFLYTDRVYLNDLSCLDLLIQRGFSTLFKYFFILFCNKSVDKVPTETRNQHYVCYLVGTLMREPEHFIQYEIDYAQITEIINELEDPHFQKVISACICAKDYKNKLYESVLPILFENKSFEGLKLVCPYVGEQSKNTVLQYFIENSNCIQSIDLLQTSIQPSIALIQRLLDKIFVQFSCIESVEDRITMLQFIDQIVQTCSKEQLVLLHGKLMNGLVRAQRDHKRIVRQTLSRTINTLHLKMSTFN